MRAHLLSDKANLTQPCVVDVHGDAFSKLLTSASGRRASAGREVLQLYLTFPVSESGRVESLQVAQKVDVLHVWHSGSATRHACVSAIARAWRPSNNQRGGSNNVVRASESGACEPDKPHSANNVLLCYTCLYPRTAA